MRWRPVGLGVMGLQDVFFQLRLPFDSAPAKEMSTRIAETIYFHALRTSMELAREFGAHDAFKETRAAEGELQFDGWNVVPSDAARWNELREEIRTHGLRNSLLIAIAPTATIASIAGCYECIEPQVSNLFKRETLSGDFLQVNRYLVAELQQLGLWTEEIRNQVKLADGSVGTQADPLRIQIAPTGSLSMNVVHDLYLHQIADTSLNIDYTDTTPDTTAFNPASRGFSVTPGEVAQFGYVLSSTSMHLPELVKIDALTTPISDLRVENASAGGAMSIRIVDETGAPDVGDLYVGKVQAGITVDLRAPRDILDLFDDADAPIVNIPPDVLGGRPGPDRCCRR